MSWAPPYLAMPKCANCANCQTERVIMGSGPVMALRTCGLWDERRYWFRKNPPRPDMGNNGADCKRYHPSQAASHPLGDDWVEFPSQAIPKRA